jgi:hypothetical protein
VREFKVALTNCTVPDTIANNELVESYQPWIKVREKAQELLKALDFDLENWEAAEL